MKEKQTLFKMADEDGRVTDRLLDLSSIMDKLHPRVSNIVQDITCKPKVDIAEMLEIEISMDLIKESRDIVFSAAVDRYNEQLIQHSIQGKANIQLILRRGDTMPISCAMDIVELLI